MKILNGILWILATLFVLGLFLGVLVPPSRRAELVRLHALALEGRNLFTLMAANDTERAAGGTSVNLASCTNSIELVRKLVLRQGANFSIDEKAYSRWTFVMNMPEPVDDAIPVMFTANFDVRYFPREWDGSSRAAESLADAISACESVPFGDKGCIFVRRGGASQIVKRKYCRRDVIFNRESFKLGADTYFLTPTGRVDFAP